MLQSLFEWMQASKLSAFFLEVTWSSPIVQCIHLVSLVVFAGSILIVDIRLLGRGLVKMPIADLARSVRPYLIGGFLGLAMTGIPMMFATALKEYYSPHFWIKMKVLAVGVVYTFIVRPRILSIDEERLGKIWPKLMGVASLSLWTVVAVYARLIGLLS